jgi:hypothetical protein
MFDLKANVAGQRAEASRRHAEWFWIVAVSVAAFLAAAPFYP